MNVINIILSLNILYYRYFIFILYNNTFKILFVYLKQKSLQNA